MNTLHHGFSGGPRIRYLPPPQRSEHTFATNALPGVTVHVLGPSRDRKVIRDMNPPKGHSYLRAAEALDSLAQNDLSPFRDAWTVPKDGCEQTYPDLVPRSFEIAHLKRVAEMDLLAVAVSLDQAVNGTSLMLLLEVGQHHLLFPGDAQWGTWDAAFHDPEWRELLTRTDFYKVGHHGSHNATPTDFLSVFANRALGAAMVSTWPNTSSWKDIPRMPLLEKLAEKTPNLARSNTSEGSSAVFNARAI